MSTVVAFGCRTHCYFTRIKVLLEKGRSKRSSHSCQSMERHAMYRLIVVGADADALDGLAGGLAAGIVGAWGADEGAVLVARGVLESALRLGGDAVGEVLRAAHLEDSGALGGAEIAGDALDLDGLFIGEAAVWLGVLVVEELARV